MLIFMSLSPLTSGREKQRNALPLRHKAFYGFVQGIVRSVKGGCPLARFIPGKRGSPAWFARSHPICVIPRSPAPRGQKTPDWPGSCGTFGDASRRGVSAKSAANAERCQASRERRSISTSSAIWPSIVFSSSMRRTPCITVVWSRPPKRRPISGRLRLVSCLHRYIAT